MKIKYYLVPFFVVVIWIVVSNFGLVNDYLLPSPFRVLDTFLYLLGNGTLFLHIMTSLMRLFVGFGVAFVLAIVLVGVFYLYPNISPFFAPTIQFIQQIPPLAMLSLIIMWFGIGEQSKIVLIVLTSFFPLFINIYNGIHHCDPKLIDLGRVVGFSKREIFSRILLPNAIPYVLLGIKIGITYGWRSLVGAEILATSTGLGAMVIEAGQLSRSDIIFVGILCFGIVGIAIDSLFALLLKGRTSNELY